MFPYSAIIAANLLNKKGGQRQANQPKIDTLNEYTLLAPEQVYDILTMRARGAGICEMADMISNWLKKLKELQMIKEPTLFLFIIANLTLKPFYLQSFLDYLFL